MQLRIWHKIIIGISIPSFIALLGSFLTYGYINNVKNRQGFVQIADDLKEQILEVRRNEKKYFHYKNAEYHGHLYDAISSLANSIKSISPETVEEIGKDKFSQLNKSIQTYSTLLNDLYGNYQQEIEVTGKVRAEGRKLETFAKNRNHAKKLTPSFILNLRRLEKNFMLFRDKNSFAKLENGLAQLKIISPLCYECSSYIEAVDNLSTTYKKSVSIVNDLQLTGNGIEQVTERIASLERQRINSFLTLTQRVVLIVVALLCTIGPLFVYKTAAYIVTPIKRLVNITKKISEGDITQRAPLKEQDETYELAMSFNTMLDNLYQTQQTCEIGKELLREKQSQLVEAERLATIGTVSSGIAHEINNPLHNIYLAAQVLSEQETSSNIVKEAVKDIYSETLRVKRIVNELLEFAREKTPELKNIYILDVINNALKMIKLPDTISNTKFNIEGPEDVYVFADGNQLEQVFINLFTNAMDAMEDSDGLLNIRINTADNNVQIKVSDTGIGISPQDISMVFDPFFTTKDKGTGLGMAIVQCIVAKNKGKVEVDSEPNKGTTFTVTLPRGNHET